MKPVLLKSDKNTTGRSKAYVKYEKLISEIERKRQFAINIEEGLRKASAKVNEELSPLEKDIHLLNRTYIVRLDELATEIGIGKYNQEWFEQYMSNELDILLDFFGHQDKVLSKLYEKYMGVGVDDIKTDDELLELAKSMREMFGFEINLDEFLNKGQKAYFEENIEKIRGNIEFENNPFSEDNGAQKNNRTEEKNQKNKRTQEDAALAKDARNIYMRLIKKFHPDLEKDPEIRDQKSEIVKQVTKAYQENDFFGLLKLQITYLDDNEAEAEKIADDMIKRYNKILQKQLNEMNVRIQEMHYTSGAIIEDFIDKNGKFSAQKFAARKRAIDKSIVQLNEILESSRKRPKGWFKDQMSFIKQAVQQAMMNDMMDSMFSDFNL